MGGFALCMASEDLNIGKIGDGESAIKIIFAAIRQQVKDFTECVLVEPQSVLFAHHRLTRQHKIQIGIDNNFEATVLNWIFESGFLRKTPPSLIIKVLFYERETRFVLANGSLPGNVFLGQSNLSVNPHLWQQNIQQPTSASFPGFHCVSGKDLQSPVFNKKFPFYGV
mgnify:CR=1 FL=1